MKSLIQYLAKEKNIIVNLDHSDIASINLDDKQLIFPVSIYEKIKETIKKQQQILISAPTEQHLRFYYNHLKTIFPENLITPIYKSPRIKQFNKHWLQILRNQTKIILGLRSVFTYPFSNLGLIIILDSNNSLYKSWDQRPFYNTEVILK